MAFVALDWRLPRILEAAHFGSAAAPRLHPDRVMPVHDLLLITHGHWQVDEEDEAYDLQLGDLLLLTAGRHHWGTKPSSKNARWIYLHFPAQSWDQWLGHQGRETKQDDASILVPNNLHLKRHDELWRLLEETVRLFAGSHHLHRRLADSFLAQILIEMAMRAEQQRFAATGASEAIMALRWYLDQHPEESLSLDELAERFALSRRVLTRDFRRLTGRSIKQYQLERRIHVARSILSTSQPMALKEIAAALGFSDAFHFSRVFKREVGMSPSEFVEQG